MQTYQIARSEPHHFFVGSPGTITIHTARHLFADDHLEFSNEKFAIALIKSRQTSTYYPGLFYYELKLKKIAL